MSRLITIFHPHHLDKIDTVSKLLLTYKNILIQMYHKGYIEKIDGISLPVRWNISKKEFVIDREDKLYPDGIDYNNIENAYIEKDLLVLGGKKLLENLNNQNFINFTEQFNITKNERRFLFFRYVNNKTNIIDYNFEKTFLLGLYQKKEIGKYTPIDVSNNFLTNFSNNFSFISNNNTGKIRESYYDFFNTMLKDLKKETISIIINDQKLNYNMEEFINSNSQFNTIQKIKNRKIKDTSINLYRNIIDKNIKLNNNEFNLIKNGFLSTHLNLLVGNYIKNKVNISGEGIIINTGLFGINNVKLVGDFILKNKESNFYLKSEEDKKYNYVPFIPFKF